MSCFYDGLNPVRVAAPNFVGLRPTKPRSVALQAEPKPAFKGDKPTHPILDSGCNDLMQAAYKGDTKKAQIPTTSKPKLSLLTQLRIAAQHLWPPEVKELVEKGADVNAQDAYGWTAASDPEPRISSSCQVAGTCGHLQAEADLFLIRQLDSVQALLDLGADVNIASKTGRTPLMSAAGNGLEEVCKLLVEQGDADIMAADEGGKTAYDLALRTGPLGSDFIRDLVAGGQTPGAGEEGWKRNPGTFANQSCVVSFEGTAQTGAYIQLGDLEAALSAASDAQELFREVGDQRAEAKGLLGSKAGGRHGPHLITVSPLTARALLRQTTELGREAGSLELAAGAEPGGGKAARSFFEGRGRNKVLTTSKEAVAMTKRLSSDHMVLLSRLAEARAKVSNGLLDEAAEDLQEVQPVLQQLGDHRAAGAAKLLQANISILRGAPDVTAAQEALECFRTANSTHEVALAQALIAKLSRVASQVPKPVVSLAKTSQPESTAAAAAVAPKPAAIDKMSLALPERVKYTLTELVAEAIGQEGMEEDRTLMETGMTSIASIMLRDKIQAEFPEIPEMDLTFVFDYPTIREMTGFVLTQLPSDA
ncbi:Tnni3k [Symbiodinium pilosum]|uniref:Tnni3k protein n=1 Tax=Symbiodinium pilosum TaxID=2952 RepID=A0A812IQE2_SYMPI|nr:Tnni3k [Symbiodinium pilosum]